MKKIGITERGDAALDTTWKTWVEKGNPAILITKNPYLLVSHIALLENPNIIVHATITGFGSSDLELNVPEPNLAFKGVKLLKKLLSPERIVVRIDPIVPTDQGTNVALRVLNETQKIGLFRVRISFLDLYEHVKLRFKANDITLPWESFHAPLEKRRNCFEKLQAISKTVVEVCGEPDFLCTGCVSEYDCIVLNIEPSNIGGHQRKHCNCLTSKTELLSTKTPCAHKCLYCYWKHNEE